MILFCVANNVLIFITTKRISQSIISEK